MNRSALTLLLQVLLSGLVVLALVDCGGGGGGGGSTTPPPAVTVSVSPATASVQVGKQQQFTATVSNATNTAVVWQVNGMNGGSPALGAIDSTGKYTAPAAVPNPAKVTVTAASQQDLTKSGSAQVTITAPAAPVSVAVSPTTATVAAGATQPFTAQVQNAANTAVAWQVNGKAGGDSTVGTIDNSGNYTAPLVPPSGGAVSVTAVSDQDSSKSGSAAVTVTFSKATLNGQYAFVVSSTTVLSLLYAAGSFSADGSGNITAGVEDVIDSTNGVSSDLSFTGTYTVGGDGRGTLTLNNGVPAFSFVLASSTQGLIVSFDGSSPDPGSGAFYKQDPAAFNSAAIQGQYVFTESGLSENFGAFAAAGLLSADGNGNFSLANSMEDLNDGGTISTSQPVSGIYGNISNSNGRGSATLTAASHSSHLAIYVVSASKVLWISTDDPSSFTEPAFAGTAEKQVLPAGQTGFSLASLSGDFVFSQFGFDNSGGNYGVAGRFNADGQGNLTAGVEDVNDEVVVTPNQSFTGTYTVGSNGRAQMTLNAGATSTGLTLYLVSPSRGFVVSTDATAPSASGGLDQETGSPFGTGAVKGSFALQLGGEGSFGIDADGTGQVAADGNGHLTGGTLDLNDGSATQPGVGITAGTYSLANDRGSLSITLPDGTSIPGPGAQLQFVIYAISKSSYKLLEIDQNGTALLSGVLWQQF